jgi:hypothetical protein
MVKVQEKNEKKGKRKMENEDVQVQTKKVKTSIVAPDTLVRLEVFRKNYKVFDGRLGREDLVDL